MNQSITINDTLISDIMGIDLFMDLNLATDKWDMQENVVFGKN